MKTITSLTVLASLELVFWEQRIYLCLLRIVFASAISLKISFMQSHAKHSGVNGFVCPKLNFRLSEK